MSNYPNYIILFLALIILILLIIETIIDDFNDSKDSFGIVVKRWLFEIIITIAVVITVFLSMTKKYL